MTTMSQRLKESRDSFVGSVIDSSTSLLAQQTHDIVRFAMGAPNADLIPQAGFDACFHDSAEGRYDYGATEGEPRLIEQILTISEMAGEPTTPDRVLVTTGGMQGLDLAFKLLIAPGDLVIVEGPTYTNGNSTALSYGAELLEAPTDENGLVVEALPGLVRQAGRTPTAIYVIPNFQNPTGTTLSRERRELLLDLAEQWDCAIIDDDPYGLLRFSGEAVPSFAAISPGNPRVFSVRTCSKILAPGLRIGWIDVDPAIQKVAINAKQAMDTCTSVPVQHAVATFLESGKLNEHLDRLRPIYRERKAVMRRELQKRFGDSVESTDPDGGFFLWLTLKGKYSDIDTQELFTTALAQGVAYIPGPSFSASGNFSNALRLCFATSTPERIEIGVERLKLALDAMLDAMPRATVDAQGAEPQGAEPLEAEPQEAEPQGALR